MSWYRVYRPQTIAGLHLKRVRDALTALREGGSIAHAYLFAGPKGTGKTSSARILAKMLNCEENLKHKLGKPFTEPCGVCENCQRITNGASLSVVEMDAASNRGIDDIRALRDRLYVAPTEGKFTVYIIDEVHMLTTEAFNALLKVLEEPPAHVVFVLATTEFHKLPDTIVSRCTSVQFAKASKEELVESLRGIAKKEHIEVGDDALQSIADRADGSFRDAVKLFEQVAQGETTLDVQAIETALAATAHLPVQEFIEALLKKDTQHVLDVFVAIEQRDLDAAFFQKAVLRSLHTAMIQAIREGKDSSESRSLLALLSVPLDGSLPVAHLPFELACVRWCLEKSGGAKEAAHIDRQEPRQSVQQKKAEKKNETFQESAETRGVVQQREEPDMQEIPETPPDIPLESMHSMWPQLLSLIHPKNASVEALLRATKPQNIQGNTVFIEVFYKFHKDQLEQDKYRGMVEEAMAQLCKVSRIRVRFILGEKSVISKKQDAATPPQPPAEDNAILEAAEEIFR